MTTVDEIRARIAEKTNRIVALGLELNHSLAIKAFEPRAFDGPGKCSIGGSSNAHRPWEGTVVFTLADGTVKTHKALDVPLGLWPKPMQDELRAIPDWKRPKHLGSL